MAAINRLETLTSMVLAPLGAPALPVVYEIDSDADILPALIKYYTHVPIITTSQHSMFTDRETVVSYENYKPKVPLESPQDADNIFYIGLVHYALRNQIGLARFDEFLLGVSVGRPEPNMEKQQLNNTIASINVGDVYYEENELTKTVTFVVGGSCVLAAMWGWGCSDVEKFPLKHLPLLSKLVGINYYTRVIAIFETGAFRDQDFEVNTSLLKSALEKAKEESEQELRAIELLPATMG